MKRIYLFGLLLVASLMSAQAQNNRSVMFSILINDGHVIDPKNVIDGVMDVAINDVKIALIDDHIETHKATQVVDAEGMYVVPGLIDRSDTRVFTFLGIDGEGYEGGTIEINSGDVQVAMLAKMAQMYRDHIVGFQTTGQNFDAVNRAVEAGNQSDLPVQTDGGWRHPAITHLRQWNMIGLTTGSGVIQPTLSNSLFEACINNEEEKAKSIREKFMPLEDLRDSWGPAIILHSAMALAGIADTDPVLPFFSSLSKNQLNQIKPVAQVLLLTYKVNIKKK